MKKIIFIIIVFLLSIFVYVNVNAVSDDMDEIIIPDAAIRVRVIAHSNSIYDQSMKMKVKSYIEESISSKLFSVSDVDEARSIISSSIDSLDNGIRDIFLSEQYDLNYSIHFGSNYFPSKDYRGVHYEEGFYESLVVTIGEGKGDNWWCVLFPPLCLLEGDENSSNDVEYQFFVQKLLNRFFG